MKIGSSFLIITALLLVAVSPLMSPSEVYCPPNLTSRDIEVLALVAGAEARGPNEGPEYVIHVILNRLEDPRWPNAIEDVVSQPLQFSTVHLGDSIEDLMNHPNRIEREAWRRIYELAGEVACGRIAENPFPDVYHFLAPQEFRMKMDPSTRQVVDIGTGPHWALGMYVHPVSDGLKHWFLVDKPVLE